MKNNITFALRAPMHAIALATLIALVAWTIGLPSWIHTAQAGGLVTISDVISDSDIGVDSRHSVTFTTETVLTAGELIRITLDPEAPQDFDFTGLVTADVSTSSTHAVQDVVGSCGSGTDFYVNAIDAINDYVEYAVCTNDTLAAGTEVNFMIGDTTQGTPHYVNNPGTANSYVVNVKTTTALGVTIDEADTRVAVIDDVTVTAEVDTIFTFSINGVAGGVTVNDDVTTTYASSTATTVPFGIIAPDTAKLMAQELRVDTNALNGFSVTVFADQTLMAGNGATIDEYVNGNAIASSTVWDGPTPVLGSLDTYGHWGLTSDDDAVSSTTPELWGVGHSAYVGNFINNPIEVFYYEHAVVQSGGMGVGTTTVAYKVEISNLQEAATDYRATLTYIATPVF
jgi:hypothetical protein